MTVKSRASLLLIACLILFTQMAVAIYVHLQPAVPASVLPLGIKPPVIPVATLLLGSLIAFAILKERRAEAALGKAFCESSEDAYEQWNRNGSDASPACRISELTPGRDHDYPGLSTSRIHRGRQG